jgi:hypothetical protein
VRLVDRLNSAIEKLVNLGKPETWQEHIEYDNLVREIKALVKQL